MKYIRTKDGVYETIGKEQPCGDCEIEVFCTKHNSVAKSWIIKQADTVEELCDEFVLIRNNIIRVYSKKHLLEESITGYCIGDEIYGAIWTDKGLIYVAKINDKGELELI